MVLLNLFLRTMSDNRSLNVMSYNCRGLNPIKSAYIKSLLQNNNVTIFMLQEHWLANGQLHMLNDIDGDYSSVGVSGFGNDQVLSGRPYGGSAILWRSNLGATVDVLPVDSNRLCAIRVTNDSYRFLYLSIYMPYEGGEINTSDFLDQLSVIENLVVENPDYHIIAGGDYNVEFSRGCLHTEILNSFCANTGLSPAIRHALSRVDYTYYFNMQ